MLEMVIKMKYKKNDVVEGRITGIEPYGIFLSIDNGYSGLIHISEISHAFVKNIHDYVKINETIKAKIIEVDENQKKLKLSIKNLNYNDEELQFKDVSETGFRSLKENLRPWIDEKLSELNQK